MKVNRAINTTLLNPASSGQLSSPLTVLFRKSLAFDAYRNAPPQAFRSYLLVRVEALQTNIVRSISATPDPYKTKLGEIMQILPTFQRYPPVYLNKPPRTVLPCDTDEVPAVSNKVLKPQLSGL